MVTHSSTSRPVQCLCMAERTGCPVLTDLWSYVLLLVLQKLYLLRYELIQGVANVLCGEAAWRLTQSSPPC
jgi:hypothetical protein